MKILWYLKQLFPLTYRSIYGSQGRVVYHTWKQWLGRSWAEEKVEVARAMTPNLEETVTYLMLKRGDMAIAGDVPMHPDFPKGVPKNRQLSADGTVLNCPRCGEAHEKLGRRALSNPPPAYQEFAICPNTSEPILIPLVAQQA